MLLKLISNKQKGKKHDYNDRDTSWHDVPGNRDLCHYVCFFVRAVTSSFKN